MGQLLTLLVDVLLKWDERTQFAALIVGMVLFSVLFLLSGRGMLILCRGWPPEKPRAKRLAQDVEAIREVAEQQTHNTQQLVQLVSKLLNREADQPPTNPPLRPAAKP